MRLLKETLKLPAEQARTLLSLAEVRQANTYDDWIFSNAVRKGYSIEERKENPGLEEQRADVIVGGLCVLVATMRRFGLDECLVSESDILDGLAMSLLADS